MNDALRDAIRALVSVRLAERAGAAEDAEAMAAEAVTLAEQIEAFRPFLQVMDSPEPLNRLLSRDKRE